MTEQQVPLSASVTRQLRPKAFSSASDSIPTRLLTQSVRRLRVVVLLIVTITAIGWIGVKILEGGFFAEFRRPGDWIPPTAGLLTSLGIYLMTRSARFGVLTILKFGLAYQVLVSYAMAVGQYWNTFHDLRGERLTPDLVGVSSVALWMAFFTILVPAKPRHALVALLLSGSAVPLTMAILIGMGNAPTPSPQVFFTIFVLPYAITVFLCMVAARIIYGLGRDADAARQLGSYRLETLLGSGGMGAVWSAQHDLLARPAAIKLIRPEALSTDPISQQSVLAMFEREAQITASLQSPHTVELYDFGISDAGDLFYVMELLHGTDLEVFVRRFGPLDPGRVVHILLQACASLAEAHQRGLVHRDIKPANLMLCETAFTYDFIKVLDFGLAKRDPGAYVAGDESLDGRRAHEFVGTPAYAAPELIEGRADVDGRTDLYSLGCVAFWLLTARTVFEESTTVAVLDAHRNRPPTTPSRFSPHAIEERLDALILSCLEKSPDARPSGADELVERLEALAVSIPWTQIDARRWWDRHGPA